MKKSFGERLKELRGDLSQDDFALKIGTKQTTLSNWERGFREPNFSGLALIATSCGVSADWLLGLTDERTPGVGPASDDLQQQIALLKKDVQIAYLRGKDDARREIAEAGGRSARPVKTGGAPAAKIA